LLAFFIPRPNSITLTFPATPPMKEGIGRVKDIHFKRACPRKR
jgi:hypothetical protein